MEDQRPDEKLLNQLIDESKASGEEKRRPFWLKILLFLFWPADLMSKTGIFKMRVLRTTELEKLVEQGKFSQETLDKIKSLTPGDVLELAGKAIISRRTIPISRKISFQRTDMITPHGEEAGKDFAGDDISRLVKYDSGPNNLWVVIVYIAIGLAAAAIVYNVIHHLF